jgi:solute carrier family 25 (mitochondrial phosphate transporter), member 23/24/25/41
MRIGLEHLMVRCPNSRCCYRSSKSSVSRSLPVHHADHHRVVTFCGFRKFFLLLPSDEMIVEYWHKAGDPGCCDVGCRFSASAVPTRSANSSPWGHLLAGAMAGAMSRTATAPLETLRLMAMTGALQPAKTTGHGAALFAAARDITRQHGWLALYRGNMANVARSAPQKALDFFAFDAFKNALAPSRSSPRVCPDGKRAARDAGGATQLGAGATLAAAGLAGAVSNVLLYPLEVVRTRLSTDTIGLYSGIGHAFQTILKMEGPLALYRCDLANLTSRTIV